MPNAILWLLGAAAVALALVHEPWPDVEQAGVVITGIILIGSILGKLFGIFGGAISAAVMVALNGLRAGLLSLGSEMATWIGRGGAWLARGVWNIVSGLVDLWRPLLGWLRNFFRELVGTLQSLFSPIIQVLVDLRHWWLQLYDRFVVPILQIIQRVRAALRLFERFGLELAGELDDTLGRVVDEINDKFVDVALAINSVLSMVDRIVTLDYVLRRPVLDQTILTYPDDLLHGWWYAFGGAGRPLPAVGADPGAVASDHERTMRDISTYIRTGGGPLASTFDRALALAREDLRA